MRERLGLPVSRLYRRRRRRAYLRTILIFTAILFILGGIVGLTYLPSLQIEEVVILGQTSVSAADIKDMVERELRGMHLFVFPKRNIFLYPDDAITALLTHAFPKLRSVEVSFHTFRSIKILVSERDPAALWCGAAPQEGGPCYLLDSDGFAFALAPEFSGAAYVRHFGSLSKAEPLRSQFLNPEAFRSLSSLVRALGAASGDEPEMVVVEGGDIRLSFIEGYEARFALADAPEEIVKRLTLAFEAEPLKSISHSRFSYIDLRFGNRLYYKLKE